MGRAYTSVIPPEFQVQATQVTNAGEPNYAPLTRQNYGSIGRSVMGSNDMQDIGGEPEVYSDEMDPLAFASQQTARMVAKLKRETTLSQTGDITKLVDQTHVQYTDITRDDQVSNVKGMRFTGDPNTVGEALKYHGDAELANGQILDGADIEATMDRAATGMDKSSRSALAQALAHLGPEALQSLPSGTIAGLNDGVQIAGAGGFAGLVVESIGAMGPVRMPTRVNPGKKGLRKMNARQFAAATRAANKRSASLRAQGAGQPSLPAARRQGQPSVTNRAEQARQQAKAQRDMPYRSAQREAAKKDTASAAFIALAAQRHREAQENARKPAAKNHPAQSNYEDSQGQANTVNSQRGAEAKRQMQMMMKQVQAQLQAAWNQMNPSQRKQAQAAVKRMFAKWQKMTPMQRQNAVKNFQQQLRNYAMSYQKKQGKRAALTEGTVYDNSTKGDVADLQAAADAQNGNQAAQQTVAAQQAQAQQKAKVMAQLTAAWNRATAKLTPTQKNQLRSQLTQLHKVWMQLTPAQRRQAVKGFQQQAAMLSQAAKMAKKGRKVTSEGTNMTAVDLTDTGTGGGGGGGMKMANTTNSGAFNLFSTGGNGVDDTGLTGGDGGLMGDDDEEYIYEDITNDSNGYSEPPINPWIIGGAVTATAIAGAMLYMSGKAK